MMMNKRGDRRGMNGRAAVRGSNGRFGSRSERGPAVLKPVVLPGEPDLLPLLPCPPVQKRALGATDLVTARGPELPDLPDLPNWVHPAPKRPQIEHSEPEPPAPCMPQDHGHVSPAMSPDTMELLSTAFDEVCSPIVSRTRAAEPPAPVAPVAPVAPRIDWEHRVLSSTHEPTPAPIGVNTVADATDAGAMAFPRALGMTQSANNANATNTKIVEFLRSLGTLPLAPQPVGVAASGAPPAPGPTPRVVTRLSFDDATNAESLAYLRTVAGLVSDKKPRSQALFEQYVRLQCACDRRDTGVIPMHVTEVNIKLPAMSNYIQHFAFSGVTIACVTSYCTDELAALAAIFQAQGILQGTADQLKASMREFSAPPFYTIVGTVGQEVVGGAVLRGHGLNNGERVVQIELIASKEGTRRGVGTTIMRVIRAFSQVSAAHTGHVCAFTLKTAKAVKFYSRQLPEMGPGARALLYSVFLLDPESHLYKKLEMRSVSVRPSLA